MQKKGGGGNQWRSRSQREGDENIEGCSFYLEEGKPNEKCGMIPPLPPPGTEAISLPIGAARRLGFGGDGVREKKNRKGWWLWWRVTAWAKGVWWI